MVLAMTFDYASKVAMATRLIGKYGQTVTLSQKGAMTGPAFAPVQGAPSTTQISIVEIKGEFAAGQDGAAKDVTRTLLISVASGAVPAKDDKILIAGMTETILKVRPLNPGGTVVLYEVDLET
jgi:hypothetical protein